jgi:hypothetical protein
VITTIILPVNVGMAVALGVIVMHLWAVKYWRILYIAFQEESETGSTAPT